MAFFELRQYKVRPGKMDEWVRLMDEEVIPFQISTGMVITGNFSGESDDSLYSWIRRFETEAERVRLYKAVYESDFWKTGLFRGGDGCQHQPCLSGGGKAACEPPALLWVNTILGKVKRALGYTYHAFRPK